MVDGIDVSQAQDRWEGSDKHVQCLTCDGVFNRAVLKRRPGDADPADALAALAGDLPASGQSVPPAPARAAPSPRRPVASRRNTLARQRKVRLIVAILGALLVASMWVFKAMTR